MEKRIKAQAQVISSLLLVAITVIFWCSVYIWYYPLHQAKVRQLEQEILFYKLALRENIVVEDVWFAAPGEVRICVTNGGDIGVTIVSVYLNNTLAWSGSVSIAPTDYSWINFTYPWSSGVYYVKLCSSRGNCWVVIARAP